jgi:hypothetical protein
MPNVATQVRVEQTAGDIPSIDHLWEIFSSEADDVISFQSYPHPAIVERLEPPGLTTLGSAGADRLLVGDDADTVLGDSGADTVSGGGGNDSLLGMLGGDRVFGGRGDDTVDGGSDRDVLGGGEGNDELWGGERADHFLFRRAPTENGVAEIDVIKDYDQGEGDVIVLGDSVKLVSAEDVGDDLLITLGGGDQILVKDSDGVVLRFNGADGSIGRPGVKDVTDILNKGLLVGVDEPNVIRIEDLEGEASIRVSHDGDGFISVSDGSVTVFAGANGSISIAARGGGFPGGGVSIGGDGLIAVSTAFGTERNLGIGQYPGDFIRTASDQAPPVIVYNSSEIKETGGLFLTDALGVSGGTGGFFASLEQTSVLDDIVLG